MTVRLRFAALEWLAAEIGDVLAATGRESGGIFLESVSGKTFVVEDTIRCQAAMFRILGFTYIQDVDRGRMAGAVELWSPNGESRLRVIGFYRSNDRPALRAGDEERKAFVQELKGVSSLLLLAQPHTNGRTTLACYVAEQGHPAGREGRIEIDSKKPEAGAAEPAAAAVSGP